MRVHSLSSPVSVSVIVTVSTLVMPSSIDGVVSADEYVGVWSFTSSRVTVKLACAEEPSALVAVTVSEQV